MALRRIWEIFPQFCGESQIEKLVMALKVYADESGKGDPFTFVMAGFVARAGQWASFEEEWREVLNREPRIPFFHMATAVAARDFARIRAMGAIIRKYRFPALAVTFYMPDYNKLIQGRISRRFDSPYFMGLTRFIELAIQWQIDSNLCEPMDFVFDEQLHESDYLQAEWGKVYASMPHEIKERFGNRPVHLDDKKLPPLQAADMLAWGLRRINDTQAASGDVDEVLDGLFTGIQLKQDVWTAEKMASLLLYNRRRNSRLGQLTEHEWAHVRQNIDAYIGGFNRHKIEKASKGEEVDLFAIPAKGLGRFLLVDKCAACDIPHLHRRSGGECLEEPQM